MNKKLITSFVFLIIGLIFTRVAVVPKYAEYRHLRNQLGAAEQTLSAKQKYYSQIFTIRERLNASQEAVSKVGAALPLYPDAPTLYRFLKTEASQNGLIFRSLGDLKILQPDNSFVGVIKFSGLIEGRYSSLLSFLQSVEHSSRLINVTSVRLLPGGDERANKSNQAVYVPRYALSIETNYAHGL